MTTEDQYQATVARRKAQETQHHLEMFQKAKVENGVARWLSNNSVPPTEILVTWKNHNMPFNFDLTVSVGKAETMEFLRRYADAQRNRTPDMIQEQRLSARAAHGPGVKLVNVITGESYTT